MHSQSMKQSWHQLKSCRADKKTPGLNGNVNFEGHNRSEWMEQNSAGSPIQQESHDKELLLRS